MKKKLRVKVLTLREVEVGVWEEEIALFSIELIQVDLILKIHKVTNLVMESIYQVK